MPRRCDQSRKRETEVVDQLRRRVEYLETDKRRAYEEIKRLQLVIEDLAKAQRSSQTAPSSSGEQCKRKCEQAAKEINDMQQKLVTQEEVNRTQEHQIRGLEKEIEGLESSKGYFLDRQGKETVAANASASATTQPNPKKRPDSCEKKCEEAEKEIIKLKRMLDDDERECKRRLDKLNKA